jgi:hypothetical protein
MTNQDDRAHPPAGRPYMPGYGISPEASGLLPWSFVDERMASARNYWISTARPDGRPHAAPVWGVWLDGTFFFGTDPRSVKGRNLAANPEIVVHLESGDEVVILEGSVDGIAAAAPDLLQRIASVYNDKYDFQPDPSSVDAPFLALRPRVVFAWLEQDFPRTATRWTWPEVAP